MTGVLYAIAQFCVERRFVVLAVWFVVAVALVAVSHQLGDNTNDNLSLPGTDSQRATDTLTKSFPAQANGTSPIVLHVTSGKLTDSKYANAVNQAAADVAKTANVASVVNPLTPGGRVGAQQGQDDRLPVGDDSVSPGSLSVEEAQKIVDAAADPAEKAGHRGPDRRAARQKVSKPATESSELIGILAAMVILTFTFGTVVGDAAPDRDRDLRAGHDAVDHPHPRPRGDGADGRADAGDDDRTRRRDRLRAVHRHPAFPRHARRP